MNRVRAAAVRNTKNVAEGDLDLTVKYSVAGFKAGGIHSGIKKNGRKDLALIYSERPSAVAGVFTQNSVKAAPVRLDIERIKGGYCQAVIINSGNANACNGEKGMDDAMAMAGGVADSIKIKEDLVLVASTGVIGEPFPIEKVRDAVPSLIENLSSEGWTDASHAILTTDTCAKVFYDKIDIAGRDVTLFGMAKGSGMVMPSMATMLAFFVTDVNIDRIILKSALKDCVDETFNMITVDGEMSTNDTVLILANGMAGNPAIKAGSREFSDFISLLKRGCGELAEKIIKDGEGATKFIKVEVQGALSLEDAKKGAFGIANSPLVKTAFFGEDGNWGRIMSSLGASLKDLKEDIIDIYFDNVAVVRNGIGVNFKDDNILKDILKKPEIKLTIDLNLGNTTASVLTTDLSLDYVKINSAYRS